MDFTASAVYGAGPIVGDGPAGLMRPRIVGSGSRRAPAATAATAATANAVRGTVSEDPTFWLVAMIGVAAGLAIWST